MNLEQEIFRVLVAAGSNGLKMEKIVRHVYNSCNSIFSPLNYKDVYNYVAQYLNKCAKDPKSIIEKGKGYGMCHINYKSSAVQQLMLDFSSSMSSSDDGNYKGNENKYGHQEQDLFS